jgi:hypothetical protein
MIQVAVWNDIVSGNLHTKFGVIPSIQKEGNCVISEFQKIQFEIPFELHQLWSK